MARLRSGLPPGDFPFPRVSSAFVSQAVASYEEKVGLYAKRAMRQQSYNTIDGPVRIKVDIQTVEYVEPLGVAKAILDALSGVVYGSNDNCVRKLTLTWQIATESKVTITVGGEQPLTFTVPGTPVGKGMCFVGSALGTFDEPQIRGIQFAPWEPPSENAHLVRTVSNTVALPSRNLADPNDRFVLGDFHVDIKVYQGTRDIDNTLRYYIHELCRQNYIGNHIRSVKKFHIEMIDSGVAGAEIITEPLPTGWTWGRE